MTAGRIRRWIGVLALLGVLVHAAAVARHNVVSLARGLADRAVAAESGAAADLVAAGITDIAICHGAAPADAPKTQDCPLCCGLASVAVLAPSLHTLPVITSDAAPSARPEDRRATVRRFARPQARGPPSAV